MLADFEPSGLLPPGIHPASWSEVEGRFGWTPWRRQLLVGLRAAMRSLKAAHCRALWLDGSFVSAKEVPGDFDGCWDPIGVDPQLLDPVLLDMTNGRRAQKMKYGGELFPSSAVESASGLVFIDFFQVEPRTGAAKGVVSLDLRVWVP